MTGERREMEQEERWRYRDREKNVEVQVRMVYVKDMIEWRTVFYHFTSLHSSRWFSMLMTSDLNRENNFNLFVHNCKKNVIEQENECIDSHVT